MIQREGERMLVDGPVTLANVPYRAGANGPCVPKWTQSARAGVSWLTV